MRTKNAQLLTTKTQIALHLACMGRDGKIAWHVAGILRALHILR